MNQIDKPKKSTVAKQFEVLVACFLGSWVPQADEGRQMQTKADKGEQGQTRAKKGRAKADKAVWRESLRFATQHAVHFLEADVAGAIFIVQHII